MSHSALLVLGSINSDLVVQTGHLPAPGETVIGGQFFRAAGGKGANQAVAASRIQPHSVQFIGAVGNDSFGQDALKHLRAESIDCDHVQVVPEAATGIALIHVDQSGENAISVASGANASVSAEAVSALPDSAFRNAKLFLASLESPVAAVVAGLRRARHAGLMTILNPAPATIEIADCSIMELVDVITPNQLEAAVLTGTSVSDQSTSIRAAEQLFEMGCGCVVLTRGREGVSLFDNRGARMVPADQVTAVDTTAAGDAFNGALAAWLAEGDSLDQACRKATAAAAISVTRRGAQPSLPYRDEIERFLART